MKLSQATKNKTKSVTSSKTLDTHHMQRLRSFEEGSAEIADCQLRLHALSDLLEKYGAVDKSSLSDNDLMSYLNAMDEERTLRSKIDSLKERELNYLLNTGNILFQYYDVLEKGNDSTVVTSTPTNSILRFFSKQSESNPNVQQKDDRAALLDRYMFQIDANYNKISNDNDKEDEMTGQCPHCSSVDRVYMVQEGYVMCNSCYTIENQLVDHDKPSYKDPFPEITYWAYKRINHFSEHLSTSQAKESTDIPDEIYDKILLEIKMQRITNMADVTPAKLKEILKKMRANKYYEHCNHILHRLNGQPVPHMTPELEERLRQMFFQIQVPFLKHAPKERKNFLSYSYVLHKFMQLLEQDQYLPCFPLLKSRDKLSQQDQIWKKICEELGWQFIKSL